MLSIDPGDMDMPLHALAIPDADSADLKQPGESALEVVALIEASMTGVAAVV